jgi:hypothetical protein
VVNHGPPKGLLDECPQGHKGCDNLLRAVRRARPRVQCFGHIHEGYGTRLATWDGLESSDNGSTGPRDCDNNVEQTVNPYPESKECSMKFREETLMVNAAIITGYHRPGKAPWLLDIELPRAQ